MKTIITLIVAALLTGCGTLDGKLDNVLTVTLAPDAKPRAFLNSTYFGLSFGAELRDVDAQALADLVRIRSEHGFILRWLGHQAQQPQAKPQKGGL